MLLEEDPELYNLIKDEELRQSQGINLIASENFTSKGVLECLGSCLTNKYSEGYPGKRYYGGNKYIDEIEKLCIKRALELFNLSSDEWGCNVQPYSGSVANLAVYLALLKPNDTLMGLDLPSGGHLTHGFETIKNKVTASATYYKSVPYKVNSEGFIDYDSVEKLAIENKPKLIICGASAYSRDFDYYRFKQISDSVGAYLMADIAHINAFIASKLMNNPFEHCDIVTTTTHKALRGPRAGIIFYRKRFESKINAAVFPGLQGGPHQNQIAAVAYQLRECMTDEFKEYSRQVLLNAKALAKCFIDLRYDIVTNGTDNHMFLINLKNKNKTGDEVEKLLEEAEIFVNKNTVPGDISAMKPSGIRIGVCAITTMGMKEEHMSVVATFIHMIIEGQTSVINKNSVIEFVKRMKATI
jgi:glycine hydroxymethyltransferase